MADEWSPWIEHHGGRPRIPGGRATIEWVCLGRSNNPDPIVSASYPGFYWVWMPDFMGRLRRVCLQEGYAPIIRYRFLRPVALRQMIDMIATVPPCKEARK